MAERNGASKSTEAPRAEGSSKPVLPTGRYREMSGFAMAFSLAFEFVAAVLLFWFLGRLVDDWLGTEPWFQMVGAVLGWIGGIYHVYYAVQRRETRETRS